MEPYLPLLKQPHLIVLDVGSVTEQGMHNAAVGGLNKSREHSRDDNNTRHVGVGRMTPDTDELRYIGVRSDDLTEEDSLRLRKKEEKSKGKQRLKVSDKEPTRRSVRVNGRHVGETDESRHTSETRRDSSTT